MMKENIDILWILLSASLVFIMQAGFAMVESGMTRSKNSINVAIKNLTDAGVSFFIFWAFGFAIMFGPSLYGLSGRGEIFFSTDLPPREVAFFFFQAVFCSTSATIVSGAVAERMKYSSYIICTIVIGLLVYPVAGHWAWSGLNSGSFTGFLGIRGFVDFAGSTVVHSVGGWVALAVLLVIGPRAGRYDADGKPIQIMGSNLTLSVVGVMILWFGWFGFNGGSTLELNGKIAGIITNTSIAAVSGMLSGLVSGWIIQKVPEVSNVVNGTLAGLVSITASAHAVTAAEAALIGAIGAIFMFSGSILLDKLKIDDAVGAVPVHLFAGIWGTVAVAFFGSSQLLATNLTFSEQLIIQLSGILIIGLWSFLIPYLLFRTINRIFPFRVTPEEEAVGLNVAEHNAHTELQNLFSTMEKQAETGDLSLRAPVESFTEAGMIAARYNSVLDKLEETMEEKQLAMCAHESAEKKYKYLVEGADAIIFTISETGIITSINKAAKKHLHVDPAAMISTHFSNYLKLDDERSNIQQQVFSEQIDNLINTGNPVEFTVFIKSVRLLEPVEFRLRLEKIEIDGRVEIMGRCFRELEDALARYIAYERVRFRIGNFLTTVEELTHRLTKNMKHLFSRSILSEIRLALREILINAIEHGNLEISFDEKTNSQMSDSYFKLITERQNDSRYKYRKVNVDYLLNEKQVVYRFTDEGNGFDHKSALNSNMNLINEMGLGHGRGLVMVKSVFEEIKYNSKGNQVLLVKKIPLSSEGA